jgi:hypothetical protein
MSTAEKNLLDAISVGGDDDCTNLPDQDRLIDSKVLAWLCMSPEATKYVTYRGISIIGAEISGTVELEFANVLFPLRASRCNFQRSIDLRSSHFTTLDLTGSRVNLTAQSPTVEHRAFSSHGLKTNAGLDLSGATIDGDLVCEGCHLVGEPDAPAIRAIGAHIKGFVYLCKDKTTGRDFKADGGLDFSSITIDNNLECDGGYFVGNGELAALKVENAEVKGSMLLRNGFSAAGKVFLRNVKVRGDLDCTGAKFHNLGDSVTIDAQGAKIEGFVYLQKNRDNAYDFLSDGEVDFSNATIEKNLQCDGGRFFGNENTHALTIEYAEIKGSVRFCDSFIAEGEVDMAITKIGGNLDCHGGKFSSPGTDAAIDGRSSRISGSVWLTETDGSNSTFIAEGQVNFTDATVEGNFDCLGGQFSGKDGGVALNGDGINVRGTVSLVDGFIARGGVSLVRAKIDGDLNCNTGHFIGSSRRRALVLTGAQIGGGVNLRKDIPQDGFTAEGGVDLVRAIIGGDLNCSGGQFLGCGENPGLNASATKIGGNVLLRDAMLVDKLVRFAYAEVGGDLEWLDIRSPNAGTVTLDLRFAKVGMLLSDQKFFSRHEEVLLDGFVFDLLGGSDNAKDQLAWLRLQPQDKFLPQPFEQMAGVLRKMGYQEEAVHLLIVKNEKAARDILSTNWKAVQKDLHKNRYQKAILDILALVCSFLWYIFFGFIGYGYATWLAFFWSLGFVVLGKFVFAKGYRGDKFLKKSDGLSATGTGEASSANAKIDPEFNALFYSLETFVPLVNLKIAEYYTPHSGFYRGYLWFHILFGWALTTLWVAGFTGLLKT